MSGNILTRMYRRVANGSPLWFILGFTLLQTGVILSHFMSAWFLLEAAIGALILFADFAGTILNVRPTSLGGRLAVAAQIVPIAVGLTLSMFLGVCHEPWMIVTILVLAGVEGAIAIIDFVCTAIGCVCDRSSTTDKDENTANTD